MTGSGGRNWSATSPATRDKGVLLAKSAYVDAVTDIAAPITIAEEHPAIGALGMPFIGGRSAKISVSQRSERNEGGRPTHQQGIHFEARRAGPCAQSAQPPSMMWVCAGGVGGFGEIDGEGGDFFGLSDATDRLTSDKVARAASSSPVHDALLIATGISTVPGQMALHAHSPLDEIGGNRLGEADDGGLGGTVDEAIRHAFDAACHRRDIDDCAVATREHPRQYRESSASWT